MRNKTDASAVPKFRIIFSVEQEFIIDKTLIILTFCNNLKPIGSADFNVNG